MGVSSKIIEKPHRSYMWSLKLNMYISRGGGGHSQYILVGVCHSTSKKGGLRHGHNPKRGVLSTGTTQKRGVLGTGTTQKGGGLKHRHESKKGGGGS